MLKRSLAGVALIVGLGASSLSQALSLGDLRLNSALNQPLEARITLRDTGNLSSEQITVKLASLEDFEKSGVDFNYLLSKLQFEVKVGDDGKGVVVIKSREPIVEPYLNFLVEARWPAGRMLREYTVLLDLPVVSDARTSAVQAAAGGAVSQAAQATPATREEVVILEETQGQQETQKGPKPREGEDRTALPRAERPTEYRVQHNDMLWDIATTYKPDGVSVQQTMLALLRKNPQAFIGDNINRLKSGYVLRLPTAEEARELSQDSAVKEIRRQNAVWRGEALPSDGELDAAPQLDATAREDAAADDAAKPRTEARLSIATPGESANEGSDGEVQQLRDELAANQENLDKVERENAELNSRLGDLERQLATLQRLLELKDDQLATLQQQMGAEPDAVETPENVAPETAATEANEEAGETVSESDEAAVEPAEAESVAAAPEPQAEAEQSLLDNPLLRYGALGALLLLLIVAFLRRFSQKKTESPFDSRDSLDEEDDGLPPMSDDFDASAMGASSQEEDDDDDAGNTTLIIEPNRDADSAEGASDNFDDFDDLLGDDSDPASDEAEIDAGFTTTESSQPVEAETDDALAEAEIYVAYGRYDQAAQMLNAAIAKEPERTDLRVKLLGVFLETRDQDKFIDAFRELEAMGDQDAIAEVKESMSAVEGVSDWLRDEDAAPAAVADTEMPSTDAAEDDLDLDFDLDDEEDFGETLIREPDAATEPTSELSGLDKAEADDLDLDSFNLDDLDADEPDSDLSLDDTVERKPAETAEEDDLSFDLDLDDDLDLGGLEDDDNKPSEGGASENLDSEELSLGDLDEDFDLGELDKELSLDDNDSEVPLTPASDLAPEADELNLDEPEIAPAPAAPAEPEPIAEEKPEAKAGDSFDDLELDDLTFDEDSAAADLDDLDSDDMSDDLGLLGDSDEVATKLDLARAYIDMGDADGAREMLQEVMDEGNEEQKQDANELLSRL